MKLEVPGYHTALEHIHTRAHEIIARGPTGRSLWPLRRRWTGPKGRAAGSRGTSVDWRRIANCAPERLTFVLIGFLAHTFKQAGGSATRLGNFFF